MSHVCRHAKKQQYAVIIWENIDTSAILWLQHKILISYSNSIVSPEICYV